MTDKLFLMFEKIFITIELDCKNERKKYASCRAVIFNRCSVTHKCAVDFFSVPPKLKIVLFLSLEHLGVPPNFFQISVRRTQKG
jgi:hypothetical protein